MKKILIMIGSIILSGSLAWLSLHYIIEEEDKWLDKVKKKKQENIVRIEASLKAYEKIHNEMPKSFFIFGDVKNIDSNIFNDSQKIRYNILLGDLYFSKYKYEKLLTQRDKDYYFSVAEKIFHKTQETAISLGDDGTLKQIKSKLGLIYMENEDWQKAFDTYNSSDSLSLLYNDDLWVANLFQAKCLKKLGNYYDSLQILEKVIGKSDNDDLWSNALIQKASLFYDIATDNEKLKKFMEKMKTSKKLEDLKLDLLKNAFVHYDEIIKEASITSKDTVLAQKGKLKIFIYRKDEDEIYNTLNKINFTSAHELIKIEALMLVAKYRKDKALALLKKDKLIDSTIVDETEKNKKQRKEQLKKNMQINNKEAIKLYNASYAKFKDHKYSSDIVYNLYLLNKKEGFWDAAFDNSILLFTKYPNEKHIRKVMIDFMPESKKNIIEYIAKIFSSTDRKKYYNIIRKKLSGLKTKSPNIWNKLYKEIVLTKAQLYFYDEEYEDAEKEFMKCLNITDYPKEKREDIYYYYYICGTKYKNPVAVKIFRSKMYLSKFPNGKKSDEMLNNLLNLYTDNGMFYSAMKIANKIYLSEINKMKKGENKNNDNFLKITAYLGKAFKEIKDFEKAEMVLKTISQDILKTPGKMDMYLDWAELATNKNQNREAIRRLNVLISTIIEKEKQIKPLVARSLLELKRDKVQYFLNGSKYLKDIEKSQELSDKEKHKLLRSLTEGLLEYAHNKKIWAINPLTDSLSKKFAGESWINYWYIRALTPLLGSSKLEVLVKKYEDTLNSKLVSDKGDEATLSFIKEQLTLINSLVLVEKQYKNLKKERSLQ